MAETDRGHRFDKGHPYYPRKDGAPPGHSGQVILRRKNLALAIQNAVDVDEITRHLWSIAQGIDPMATTDANGAKSWTPISMLDRLRALKMLTDRGWGLPAQLVALQANIKQELDGDRGAVDVRGLPADKLLTLRAALRDVLPDDKAIKQVPSYARTVGSPGAGGGSGGSMGGSSSSRRQDEPDDVDDDGSEP